MSSESASESEVKNQDQIRWPKKSGCKDVILRYLHNDISKELS